MSAPVNRQSYRRTVSSGFTLIELMVTIAVMAIIVSIAVPSMNRAMAENQMKATSSLIQTSISRAKAESTIMRSDITWSYSSNNNQITLVNKGNTIASYDLNSNSSLTFDPPAATTLVIKREGVISIAAGSAVNLAIDVSDSRISTTTQRVWVNTKRAFECSGANC